eukprot:15468855-Alexandrium_andersonii.AAC.1
MRNTPGVFPSGNHCNIGDTSATICSLDQSICRGLLRCTQQACLQGTSIPWWRHMNTIRLPPPCLEGQQTFVHSSIAGSTGPGTQGRGAHRCSICMT